MKPVTSLSPAAVPASKKLYQSNIELLSQPVPTQQSALYNKSSPPAPAPAQEGQSPPAGPPPTQPGGGAPPAPQGVVTVRSTPGGTFYDWRHPTTGVIHTARTREEADQAYWDAVRGNEWQSSAAPETPEQVQQRIDESLGGIQGRGYNPYPSGDASAYPRRDYGNPVDVLARMADPDLLPSRWRRDMPVGDVLQRMNEQAGNLADWLGSAGIGEVPSFEPEWLQYAEQQERTLLDELDRLSGPDPFGNQARLEQSIDRAAKLQESLARSSRGGAGVGRSQQQRGKHIADTLRARGREDLALQVAEDERLASELRIMTTDRLTEVGRTKADAAIQTAEGKLDAFQSGLDALTGMTGLTQWEQQFVENLNLAWEGLDQQGRQRVAAAAIEIARLGHNADQKELNRILDEYQVGLEIRAKMAALGKDQASAWIGIASIGLGKLAQSDFVQKDLGQAGAGTPLSFADNSPEAQAARAR